MVARSCVVVTTKSGPRHPKNCWTDSLWISWGRADVLPFCFGGSFPMLSSETWLSLKLLLYISNRISKLFLHYEDLEAWPHWSLPAGVYLAFTCCFPQLPVIYQLLRFWPSAQNWFKLIEANWNWSGKKNSINIKFLVRISHGHSWPSRRGVAPANQTKERPVHELFPGAFQNKSSMWTVLVFPRKTPEFTKKRAKFMNFSFWPFLWFGFAPGRLPRKVWTFLSLAFYNAHLVWTLLKVDENLGENYSLSIFWGHFLEITSRKKLKGNN